VRDPAATLDHLATAMLVVDPRASVVWLNAAADVLASVRGRRQEAAKLIGWGRNTLTRKLRELGID